MAVKTIEEQLDERRRGTATNTANQKAAKLFVLFTGEASAPADVTAASVPDHMAAIYGACAKYVALFPAKDRFTAEDTGKLFEMISTLSGAKPANPAPAPQPRGGSNQPTSADQRAATLRASAREASKGSGGAPTPSAPPAERPPRTRIKDGL